MGQRLGQHFLRDARVLDDILAAAALRPDETVLEIGPGKGALTRRLAAACARVVAVEADAAMVPYVQDLPRVEITIADAARFPLDRLGPFDAVVANLPYQVSAPITFALLDLLAAMPWRRAVLMYQKEFAERLRAGPGSKVYGRLSVHAARLVRVEKIRDVAPGAFDPPPEVMSQVVRLVPHEEPPFDAGDLFRAVVDGAFATRRKKLKNALPPHLPVPRERVLVALDDLGSGDKRAEELSPADFAALSRALED